MFSRKFVAASAVLFFSLVLLAGCGDSNLYSGLADNNTTAAKRDRGVAALSSGNWDDAVRLLEELYKKNPDDPEIQKYLASAYVGQAGFDTLVLITEIAKAQEGNVEGSILFDSVLGIFSDEEGSFGDLGAKIDLVGMALDVLAPSDKDPNDLSREQKVQAGLYASMQTIMITANILGAGKEEDLDNLSDEEIENLVRTNFDDSKDDLERSLALVTVARDELVDTFAVDGQDSNDIGEEFDIFIADIGFDDGELDEDDLIQYLKLTL